MLIVRNWLTLEQSLKKYVMFRPVTNKPWSRIAFKPLSTQPSNNGLKFECNWHDQRLVGDRPKCCISFETSFQSKPISYYLHRSLEPWTYSKTILWMLFFCQKQLLILHILEKYLPQHKNMYWYQNLFTVIWCLIPKDFPLISVYVRFITIGIHS